MTDLISQHLDLWTTAIVSKSRAGRGNKSPSPAGEGRGEGNPTSTRNAKYTAYGIKKLRELILELAVRGKLVPQDPNDEPASTFLKKLAEEKSQLIMQGKIKKQKSLPEIDMDEMPYLLPKGWEWARLGNICTKLTDGSHNPPNDAGSGFPMLSSQNINFGEIDFSSPSRYVSKEDFEKENQRTQVAPGDVLLTIVASLGRSAVVPDGAPKFVLQRSVAVFRNEMNPNFFALQLVAPHCLNYYDTHGKGTAQKGVYLGKLALMEIAVPPLSEQHRIVAKVDELMALCDQLEQQQTDSIAAHQTLVQTLLDALIARDGVYAGNAGAISGNQATDAAEFEQAWSRIADHFDTLFTTEASIDQLKQTILQLAVMGKLVPQNHNGESARLFLENIFKEKKQLVDQGIIRTQKAFSQIEAAEKPQNIPVSWELSRLGEFTIVGTGSTPSRDKASYYFPPEVNWVTSGETSQNFIFETNEKISKIALKETNVSVYPIGTLIIAMYGQGKTRGQVSELMIEAGTNQACAAVVCVNKEVAHRRFIKLFFMKAYEELRSHSAGGAQPNLNLAKISNTVIPIPPLEEQHRIVAKVEELMALCDALKARIAAAQTTQLQLADAIVEQAVA